jgi:hypothetical protein
VTRGFSQKEGVSPQDLVGRSILSGQFIGDQTSKEVSRCRRSRWLWILYRLKGSQVSKGECGLRVSLISERVSWLRGRADHSKEVPPQVQVGERHLPRRTDMSHELRRPYRSFRGRRLLRDVRPLERIHLFLVDFSLDT